MIAEGIIVSSTLFAIGLIGLLINQRNALLILVHIELMLLSVNTNFILFNQLYDQPIGHLFVFFILTCAAAETAIGLAIFILLYRKTKSVDTKKLNHIKG